MFADDLYPEHTKMMAVTEESRAIGEFLEASEYDLGTWIEAGDCHDSLCNQDHPHFTPTFLPIQRILAEYFGVDLDKIEAEKRAMLDEIRKANQ